MAIMMLAEPNDTFFECLVTQGIKIPVCLWKITVPRTKHALNHFILFSCI